MEANLETIQCVLVRKDTTKLSGFCDIYCDEGIYINIEVERKIKTGLGYGLHTKNHTVVYGNSENLQKAA